MGVQGRNKGTRKQNTPYLLLKSRAGKRLQSNNAHNGAPNVGKNYTNDRRSTMAVQNNLEKSVFLTLWCLFKSILRCNQEPNFI